MDSSPNIALRHLKKKDLQGLKHVFASMSVEERGEIVNEKIDGNSTFYLACKLGEKDFVEYLLDECNSDITLNGTYDNSGELLHVSPLWAAAADGKFDVVKCLVQHNASVNISTETGSTPLRASSYGGHYDVAKFLIEQGADVNKLNSVGSAPLTCATRNDLALCKLLITNGASVNFGDMFGCTPLTYAVEDGRLDLVKLFMHHKGDCNIRKQNGDTIIRVAALYSTKPVLDYLIQRSSSLKKIHVIEAYELFGCTLVDTYNDLEKAIFVWKKAMALRETMAGKKSIPKTIPNVTANAYENYVEPTTLKGYMRRWEPKEVHMNALLVRERILGKSHRNTVRGINIRADIYYRDKQYKRCLELWKYAYILECEYFPPTDVDPIRTVQTIVSFFFVMQSEFNTQQTETRVSTGDYLQLFNMIVSQVENGVKQISIKPLDEFTQSNFDCLLVVILHFINFRFNLELSEIENANFLSKVKRLVMLSLRTDNGDTLLHLALVKDNSTVNKQFCSRFPSFRLVQILIENGANVNNANDSMDTVLHLAIPQIAPDTVDDECLKIVNYLIKQNVHFDVRNNKGHCVLTWLENRGFPVCPVRDRTLACLAAETIIEHGIPFESTLSCLQIGFVKSHGFILHRNRTTT